MWIRIGIDLPISAKLYFDAEITKILSSEYSLYLAGPMNSTKQVLLKDLLD